MFSVEIPTTQKLNYSHSKSYQAAISGNQRYTLYIHYIYIEIELEISITDDDTNDSDSVAYPYCRYFCSTAVVAAESVGGGWRYPAGGLEQQHVATDYPD